MKCLPGFSETERAYLAGLIDADGYISLVGRDYKGKKVKNLRPMIGFANRSLKVIKWILKKTSFGNYNSMPKPPIGRATFQCNIGTGKVNSILILETILPYLKIKKRRAELVLEFCKNHKQGIYTARDWQIYRNMKRLNQRGKWRVG